MTSQRRDQRPTRSRAVVRAALAGRGAELAEMHRLVDAAAAGSGGALVLSGEVGIGKSTLLDEIARTVPDGALLLSVRAVESESHLAYAAAVDLIGPLLDDRDVVEGLGPQAFGVLEAMMQAQPGAGGPMPVCRAALGALLAATTNGRLVVLVIDDAQHLDEPSAEVVLYLARRLAGEHVALFAGVRSDASSRLLAADLPQRRIDGLSVGDFDALLSDHRIARSVVEQLHGVTRGNPLAVLEIAAALSADERAANVPLARLPAVGPTIVQAFERRLASVPLDARDVLLLVAAHGPGHVAILRAALDELGHRFDEILAAERHQIVVVSPSSVDFAHPLMRLVVYSSASPASRRAAHAALARAWRLDQPERAAWHLAESAPGPDESIAVSIESTAEQTRHRPAAALAGELFERAAMLSVEPLARERRLMAAARCFDDAGRPSRADTMLRQVLATTSNAVLRADAIALRGVYIAFGESPTVACEMLRAEALRIEGADPDRAILLLATAYTAALLAVDFTVGAGIADDAARVAVRAGPVGVLAANALGMQAALFSGRTQEALTKLAPLAQLGAALAATGAADADYLLQTVALAELVLDRWQDARTTIGETIARGRAAGRDGSLAFAYAVETEAALRLGRWTEAYIAARRAGDLYADHADRRWATLSSLALRARVEAHLGLADECREHAAAVVEGAGSIGSIVLVSWARHALGLLALSSGEYSEAVRHLEFVGDVVRRSGVREPGYVNWAGDLIEAYWRGQRTSQALAVRSTLRADAESTGRLSAMMVVHRADALLGPIDRSEQAFAASLEIGERIAAPFEVARTHLLQAEWRLHNGGDAATSLRSAQSGFERLGAPIWADRCRSLGAVTKVAQPPSPARVLAERELEAALLAARGLTNREIADELYLSPKTVENTLGKVYRKLDVRSRTQLAILMLNSVADVP